MNTLFDRKKLRLALTATVMLLMPCDMTAQSDDFGIWATVDVDKTFNDRWSAELEVEMRTMNNVGALDCWSWGANGTYKLTPWLKAVVGYEIFLDYYREHEYHDDGTPAKRANYTTPSHRVYTQLIGSVTLGRFNFALRERWQWTYRVKKTVSSRYDYDLDADDGEEVTFSSNGKNMLRSRLMVKYDLGRCPLTPYGSVELFNAWALDRTRYTLGVDWQITNHHTAGLYYRFQDKSHNHIGRRDIHILGFTYAYAL